MKKFHTIKIIYRVFALLLCIVSATPKTYSQLGIGISASITLVPPALPVYVQPYCPGDGYIWTPGYWSYGDEGYFWVPGVWVMAPQAGYLWTPCYWGFSGGFYGFHSGYWGEHVGFYGGVNYGFGYGGSGYGGGRWNGGHFQYNTAVSRVNVTNIHNTYIDRTVIINNNSHTSFNGPGGTTSRPTAGEQQAMNEHHIQPTAGQSSHQLTASRDRSQLATVNHGRPTVTAMNKVGGRSYGQQGHAAAKVGAARPAANANRAAAHPATAPRASTATRATATANRPIAHTPAHTATATHTGTATARRATAPASENQPARQVSRPQPQAARHTAPARAPQQHAAAPHASAPRQQPARAPQPRHG